MLGELLRIARFHVVHRLRNNLERVVITPRLVVGKLPVSLHKRIDVSLRARRVDKVMPHKWPDAGEIALAGAPRDDRVKAEARDRKLQPVLRILLEEISDLIAGEIRHHKIGSRLPDL